MESLMNTFTLRKIPVPVERRLRQLARESHKSINKTALELLSQAVGIGHLEKKTKKYRDVKSVLRQWTAEEYNEFLNNTKIFDSIDENMWHS